MLLELKITCALKHIILFLSIKTKSSQVGLASWEVRGSTPVDVERTNLAPGRTEETDTYTTIEHWGADHGLVQIKVISRTIAKAPRQPTGRQVLLERHIGVCASLVNRNPNRSDWPALRDEPPNEACA